MFEQTFVEGANTTRKASSVFVSFLIQCGLVIVGILIPLIYTETSSQDTAHRFPRGASAAATSAAAPSCRSRESGQGGATPVRRGHA